MTNLIPLEELNAVQVFTVDGIEPLLEMIKAEVADYEADITTAKGRAECKSLAYKITLSKGVIDRAGKELVSDLKEKVSVIDTSRRVARVFLDDLSAEVRHPLTKWEDETAKLKAEAELKEEIEQAHAEALALHQIWEEKHALAAKAAELKAREEALEKARIEEESEKEAEARRQQEQAELLAKAEADKEAAVEAERKRVLREQAEAEVLRKQQEQIQAEAARIASENKEHRRQVNAGALEALMEHDITREAAVIFITLVYQDKIPGMRMVY